MTYEDFQRSISEEKQPVNEWPPSLRALWYDARGDWTRAHEAAQEGVSKDNDWVHAYLHRKEGDRSNAEYWYKRAGKPYPELPLEEEWTGIVQTLCTKQP